MNKSFTILEVVIVLVILTIMFLALGVKFTNSFDVAANRQASVHLDMIIADYEIYRTMDTDNYYLSPSAGPYPASAMTTEGINANLGMRLSTANSRDWDYAIINVDETIPPEDVCAVAVRVKKDAHTSPCWQLCTNTTKPAQIACP